MAHDSISNLLRVLRRQAGLVLVCCIATPFVTFLVSASQEKQYTASASLLFRDAGFDQTLFGSETLQRSTDPDREAATNFELVSLDTIAQRAQSRLPNVGSVEDKVTVSAAGQSDVVSVAATDGNPETAARIANVFSQKYIAFRRQADRAKITEARDLVSGRIGALPLGELNGPQARSLRDRLEQLDILASLQTGNAEIAEAAEAPASPSSPKVARNTVLGAVLGVLLGIGLALLAARLDRRLREAKEMEAIFERPILGAIPASRRLSDGRAEIGALGAGEEESFRMMRANLRYFNVDQDIKSVLVTSAAPGDGKTTVAMNLAVTAAAASRVLLIEADLRHPAVAIGLGLGDAVGLSTVLAGEADIPDVARRISLPANMSADGPGSFDVVLAGPLPPNPSDLLESDRMREVITGAEQRYDLVVIDTPPTSVVSDAIPLVTQVGGVMVVGRLGRTTREGAEHLCSQLRHLDAPVLGVVVNGVGSGSGAYGYAYGYGAHYGIDIEDGKRAKRFPRWLRRGATTDKTLSEPPSFLPPGEVGTVPGSERTESTDAGSAGTKPRTAPGLGHPSTRDNESGVRQQTPAAPVTAAPPSASANGEGPDALPDSTATPLSLRRRLHRRLSGRSSS